LISWVYFFFWWLLLLLFEFCGQLLSGRSPHTKALAQTGTLHPVLVSSSSFTVVSCRCRQSEQCIGLSFARALNAIGSGVRRNDVFNKWLPTSLRASNLKLYYNCCCSLCVLLANNTISFVK